MSDYIKNKWANLGNCYLYYPQSPMIALVDCNNFYASCEQVFDLSLCKKPLVILSNNDGCVIARSSEAKKLNIAMGQPAFTLQALIQSKKLQVRSSNFALYADMSKRVMQTLYSLWDEIEIYSIDEAFLSFKGLSTKQIKELALSIKTRIYRWTGISVSIGIGPTKTLAKLANKYAKKKMLGGIFFCDDSSLDSILAETSLENIWGIGKNLAQRLKKIGIYNALGVKNGVDLMLKKALGVTGLRIALELRGISVFNTCDAPLAKKSIASSRTFKEPICDKTQLEEAISNFVVIATKKLQKANLYTQHLSIYITTSRFVDPFYANSCQMKLPRPTAYAGDLIFFAKNGLNKIYKPDFLYTKAHILLSDLGDKRVYNENFLSPRKDLHKEKKLIQTMEEINRKYHKEAIFFAAQGLKRKWESTRRHISPKYTTKWSDLLQVY